MVIVITSSVRTSYEFVEVCVHELEDQGQAASGLVVQHLFKGDHVLVRGQPPQRLDLAEVVDLHSKRWVVGSHRGTTKGRIKQNTGCGVSVTKTA